MSSAPSNSRVGHSLSEEMADWNPFHEHSKSENLSEDQFFGAEFDKIRRGSQSSKSLKIFVRLKKESCYFGDVILL